MFLAAFAFLAAAPEPSLSIDASRTECTAPCGVHFLSMGAEGIEPERTFVGASYSWDFGDEGAVFGALPSDFPHSADANHAEGPIAAHVFEEPGRYEVTLRASGSRGEAVARTTIEVADPDRVFRGGRTVCYSLAEDWKGCPGGARQATTLKSAYDAVRAGGRLLLRAGEESPLGETMTFRGTKGLLISRYGEGADPVLLVRGEASRAFYLMAADDITLAKIEVRGDYSAATGRGGARRTTGLFSYNGHPYDARVETSNVTIHKTRFTGLSMAYYPGGKTFAWVFSQNHVSDWQNFGVLTGSLMRGAFIGNAFKQNPDAVFAPDGNKNGCGDPCWANHGPLRVQHGDLMVIDRNDLFSNTGWYGPADHQPALRFNTDGLPHTGNIRQNRLHGGYTVLQTIATGRKYIDGGRLLIEGNLLIGSSRTAIFFDIGSGGTAVRNNVAVMPDIQYQKNSFGTLVRLPAQAHAPGAYADPVEVTGNSFLIAARGKTRPVKLFEHSPKGPRFTEQSTWSNVVDYRAGRVTGLKSRARQR